MPIARTAVQVHAAMVAKIRAGADGWRPGEKLPPWKQLAPAFETSLGTIARVMPRLAREGWTVPVPGAGTWVAEKLPTVR